MSLTSIIDGRGGRGKELKQLLEQTRPRREQFQTMSGRTPFMASEYQLHVPCNLSSRGLSGIVGTAFDYLARAMVARQLDENESDFFHLGTAMRGMNQLAQFPFSVKVTGYEDIQKRFEESLQALNAFIEDTNPPSLREVAGICGGLARFDHLARQSPQAQLRIIEWTLACLSEELAEVVDDLENLATLFQSAFIDAGLVRPDSEVFFNPCFPSSPLLRGADADIIVDGTLYDFKTTKDCGYQAKDASQLWGYCLLSWDDGMWVPPFMFRAYGDTMVFSPANGPLERIALYRARFGEVEYVDLASLDIDVVRDAQERFEAYLLEADWW